MCNGYFKDAYGKFVIFWKHQRIHGQIFDKHCNQYTLLKREKDKKKGVNHKKKINANGEPGAPLAPNLT